MKLINNSVFRKTTENVRKHRSTKFGTTDRRESLLVWEPNYHTTKWYSGNLLAIEINRTEVKINKLVYLSLLILDMSKIIDRTLPFDESLYFRENLLAE